MSEEQDFSVSDKRSSSIGEEAAEQSSPPSENIASKTGGGHTPPGITFSTFLLSLSTSVAMSLGGYQDPQSGHIPRNLEHAKQSIDILAIIQDKTEGNLTPEEKDLLERTLYELRMRYVEEVKKG